MGITLAATSLSQSLKGVLSSTALWGAVLTCLVVVFLGYFLARKHFFPAHADSVFIKLVLYISLPCLAFTSFLVDFSNDGLLDLLVNLLLGFVLYPLFILLGYGLFAFIKDPTRRKIMALLFAFGSGTFFAQPFLSVVYGELAYNDSNMLNISFRVFLYSYVYVEIMGDKLAPGATSWKSTLKKILLNPILIGTFAGLLLWALQAIPGSTTAQWWTLRKDWLAPVASSTPAYVPFWRIDVSLPWVTTVLKVIGGLTTPLIYLAIGLTLGEKSITEAAKDKLAWYYAFLKIFVGPGILLALLYAVEGVAKACGYPQLISLATVQSTVLMWAVPTATVAVAYCLEADKEKALASDASVLATLVYIPGEIVWVLLLALIQASGFFYVAA
jgi:predicted permease